VLSNQSVNRLFFEEFNCFNGSMGLGIAFLFEFAELSGDFVGNQIDASVEILSAFLSAH